MKKTSPVYTYILSKNVQKFLRKRDKVFLRLLLEKLEIMMQNPFDSRLDVKKISWKKNVYRLRVSKYRLLYEIIDQEILIYFYKADSRGDIY